VKNGVTLAIIGLMLMAEATLHSAVPDNLPAECTDADFKNVGRPLMFPPYDGLSLGISTSHTTLQVGDAVLIFVWVNNQTDDDKVLGSCDMWWDWGVTVYDAQWHEIKTHRAQERERRHEQPLKLCMRNIALRVPRHRCGPLQDMGNVKVDLREDRELPTGQYFVTEKRPTSSGNPVVAAKPTRSLRIVIADKKPGPDDQTLLFARPSARVLAVSPLDKLAKNPDSTQTPQ
jgi:hypothetical protein